MHAPISPRWHESIQPSPMTRICFLSPAPAMTTVSRLLLLSCVVACATARNTKLKEVFAWKQIDFNFPTEKIRQSAILTGDYITKNNLPLGVEAWKNRVFVTVPRWKAGIPASLTYVDVVPGGDKSTAPKLTPYPDWETNKLPQEGSENNTHIVSTFRVRVDACDRLWVMDTGLADILGTPKQYFRPQILIYDLNTDKLIRKFSFPEENIKEHTFFANIIVDTDGENKCEDAFAYIPDLGSYAMIVYSFKDNEAWRVKHHYFFFDPLQGDYNVGGVNFQWTDGVFGVALSKRNEDGFKTAYFHALSSTNEFAVSTRILQNKTIASESYNEYRLVGNKGPKTQASASFLDEKTGVLFYTQVNRDGVACWNSNEKTITPENQGLVTSDSETFVFTNDLKVDRNGMLWVLSDRMPKYIYSEIDPEQVNYRIFTASVKDAIKGTVCDKAADTPQAQPTPVEEVQVVERIEESRKETVSKSTKRA